MIPTDEIYYADNEGVRLVSTDKEFIETHRLRCKVCHNVFMTVLPIGHIKQGNVTCPKCSCNDHTILDASKAIEREYDMFDSWLYAMQTKQKIDMEDKNMKRTEPNIEKDQNITITRRCDTSRGVFTVKQLEPTDMFVLIDDEDQTVYMAVYEEDPKYKTKQAVVDMHSGNLLYLDISTKIHVYRPGCELRVGEFIWTSEGYN